MDHLFVKSKYPFFEISIFNLVPSCYECNSCLKGDFIPFENEDHLNPYSECFHSLYTFNDSLNVDKDTGIDWDLFDEQSFNLVLEPKDQNKADVDSYIRADINKNLFALTELYNCHKEVILPIIFKANIYGFGRLKDIQEKVEALNFSPIELKRLIFGNVIKEKGLIKKVPFSKITLDIASKYEIPQSHTI